MVKRGGSNIAIVEYLGVLPGLGLHDNSKRKRDYMRTWSTVMQKTSNLLQKHKPQDVCNKQSMKNCVDKSMCSRFMTKSKMTRNETDAMTLDRQSAEKNHRGSYC